MRTSLDQNNNSTYKSLIPMYEHTITSDIKALLAGTYTIGVACPPKPDPNYWLNNPTKLRIYSYEGPSHEENIHP